MEYLMERRLINRANLFQYPSIKVYFRDICYRGVLVDLSELGAQLKIEDVSGIDHEDILNVCVDTPFGSAGFIGSIMWSIRGNSLISAGIRYRFLSTDRFDPYRIFIKRSFY